MAVLAKGQITLQEITEKYITQSRPQYYLSTSSTSLTGGSWQWEPPDWIDGRFYWFRMHTTYSDGSTSGSAAYYCGGSKNAYGSSLGEIVPEYYLSTSGSEMTGGEWSTAIPEWQEDRYLWVRQKVKYVNPTSESTTTPTLDTSWMQTSLSSQMALIDSRYSKEVTDLETKYESIMSRQYVTQSDVETQITNASAAWEQTYNGFQALWNTSIETLSNNQQEIAGNVSSLQSYITLADGTMILGRSDSDINCRLENDRLSFMQNGSEVAYIADTSLRIKSADIDGFTMGNFLISEKEDGSIVIKWRD